MDGGVAPIKKTAGQSREGKKVAAFDPPGTE